MFTWCVVADTAGGTSEHRDGAYNPRLGLGNLSLFVFVVGCLKLFFVFVVVIVVDGLFFILFVLF